jgi:hypothetical protein
MMDTAIKEKSMRSIIVLTIMVLAWSTSTLLTDTSFSWQAENKPAVQSPQPPPPPRIVKIDQKLIDAFTDQQKRTTAARQDVWNSPQWKNLQIFEQQEESVIFAIMGEVGIKPITDKCVPVYLKDGKRIDEKGNEVTSINGKLSHFECPAKEAVKP